MLSISSSNLSFMLNGCELGNLTPQRGIRQDCPLSPYLFIICSEIFLSILQELQTCGKLQGFKIACTAPCITHMFFADDTLLLGRATLEEASQFRFAIDLYERVSGQKINYDKSGILFSPNTATATRASIYQILNMNEDDSHGKYLGLPTVIGKKKRVTKSKMPKKCFVHF